MLEVKPVVESSADVMGGTPVFAGTRVPVKNLIDYIEAGDTLEEFLDAFPSVSRDKAIPALAISSGPSVICHQVHGIKGVSPSCPDNS